MAAVRPAVSRTAVSARSPAGPPRLAIHHQGYAAYPHAGQVAAVVGVESNGRIVAIGAPSSVVKVAIKDTDAGWVLSSQVGSETAAPVMAFADTNGNVFFSLLQAAVLYRIPSGSSTPTAVLSTGTTPAMAASSQISTMCEDDQGSLYAAQYLSGSAVGLFKSTDSGATWSKIVSTTFPGSGFAPDEHLHVVHWDRWRKMLLVTSGDADNSYIQCSLDYGTTWFSWDTGFEQATACVATETSIWFASDENTDRGIYECVMGDALTENAIQKIQATRRFNPETDAPDYVNPASNFGFAWWGHETEDGDVAFGFSPTDTSVRAYLVVCQHGGGFSLFPCRTPAGSATSFAFRFAESLSRLGPWRYGVVSGHGVTDFVAWRVTRARAWQIDESNGYSFHLASGLEGGRLISDPCDYGIPWQIPYQLAANHTGTFAAHRQQLQVDKNGYDFTGSVTYVTARDQDCEGDPLSDSWTASSSTTTLQSTEQVQEGTYSVKLVVSSGITGKIQRVNVWSGTTSGELTAGQESIWASYWTYYDAHSFANGNNQLCVIDENGDSGNYLRFVYDPSLTPRWRIIMTINGVDSVQFVSHRDADIPLGRWVQWKIHVFRDDTEGRIQWWLDKELLIDAEGLNTMPGGDGNWDAHLVGQVLISGTTYTVHVDNIQCGYTDPDEPSGLVLNGSLQTSTA